MLKQEDFYHVGIIVDDFDAALELYSKQLGLTWSPLIQVPLQIWTKQSGLTEFVSHAVYSQQQPCIEIVKSVPGTVWQAIPGRPLHHMGYWVDDLDAVSAHLESEGSTKVACAMSEGKMFGFAYHEMSDGTYLELVDRTSFADWPAFLAGKMQHEVNLPD